MFVPAPPAQAQLGYTENTSLSTGYRVAFDLYVDIAEADLPSIPQVGLAQAVPRNGGLNVDYVLGPGATSELAVYRGPDNTPFAQQNLPVPPVRTWTRIVLVYDVVQGVSLIEDGETIGALPQASGVAPGPTVFIVGGVFSNPAQSGTTTSLTVDLDTVVLRGQ